MPRFLVQRPPRNFCVHFLHPRLSVRPLRLRFLRPPFLLPFFSRGGRFFLSCLSLAFFSFPFFLSSSGLPRTASIFPASFSCPVPLFPSHFSPSFPSPLSLQLNSPMQCALFPSHILFPRPSRPLSPAHPPFLRPRFTCFYLPGNVVCYAGIKSFFTRYFACISY